MRPIICGRRGGVQALLKVAAPTLIFVHCRSHLLQLALVKASTTVVQIKYVLSALTSLYFLFPRSPLSMGILKEIETAVDGLSHKLVQPGSTRWLSHDASVSVVLKHYTSICLALEMTHTEAGDLSSTAAGLLLTFRKVSTLQFLLVLQFFLQSLARLSKTLQASLSNIAAAMTVARATTASLRNGFKLPDIQQEFHIRKKAAGYARVIFNTSEDLSERQIETACLKFHAAVIDNMENRFSDDVSNLCDASTLNYCLGRRFLSCSNMFPYKQHCNSLTAFQALFSKVQLLMSILLLVLKLCYLCAVTVTQSFTHSLYVVSQMICFWEVHSIS